LDQAIELLRKARAANPPAFGTLLILAGALGLRGDLHEARAELAEASTLKPEVNSLAAWRAYAPWIANPYYARQRLMSTTPRRLFPQMTAVPRAPVAGTRSPAGSPARAAKSRGARCPERRRSASFAVSASRQGT
jgi:hypothetical protein